jgi:signal transduction histidine kinase
MKTILALAPTPALAESIGQALLPENFRVLHRTDAAEAEPLLKNGFIDFCILDAEGGDVRLIWQIEKIRQWAPDCPLVVYKSAAPWDWEEDAYLHGVASVLTKPVRPKLLAAMLERYSKTAEPSAAKPLTVKPALTVAKASSSEPGAAFQNLNILKNFSAVLAQSLSAEGMLNQFLTLLRQTLGVTRAAIFVRRPAAPGLRVAASLGIAPGILENLELSPELGMGAYFLQNVRILKRDSDEVASDPEIQKEFQFLGMQTAVPMLARGQLAGVLVLDTRLTGEPLANSELELVFHLLEEVGLALGNIALHDQLAANNALLGDVLRELTSACVVVNRNLGIIHANKAARNLFSRGGKRAGELEFSDLPNDLGIKIFQVLNTGTGIATFKHHPTDSPNSTYHVSIVPVQAQGAPAALLIVEDYSQQEQLRRLEVEASNLRLVKNMADRLAHEIGNALVPLSTHHQLLHDKYKDPEFRASLEAALADSVKRIGRLTSQMRYLARDSIISKEALPLAQLVEEAFQEAQKYQPLKSVDLKLEKREQPIVLAGDRAALKHAVAEVLLNALQANPSNAKVEVRTHLDDMPNGASWVHIDIQDNGPGFSSDAAKKVPTPFFTTKNVGLGLGLAVTQKIVETHHGKLAVINPKKDQPGIVRISLPLDASAA